MTFTFKPDMNTTPLRQSFVFDQSIHNIHLPTWTSPPFKEMLTEYNEVQLYFHHLMGKKTRVCYFYLCVHCLVLLAVLLLF